LRTLAMGLSELIGAAPATKLQQLSRDVEATSKAVGELKATQARVVAVEESLAALRSDVAGSAQGLEKVAAIERVSQEQKTHLEGLVQSVAQRLEEASSKTQAQVAELTSTLSGVSAKLAEVAPRSEMQAAEATAARAAADVAALRDQLQAAEGLQQRLKAAETDVVALRQELDSRASASAALTAAAEKLQQGQNALKDEAAGAAQDRRQLTQNLAEVNQQLEGVQAAVASGASAADLKAVQSQLAAALQRVDAVERELKAGQAAAAESESGLSSRVVELERLVQDQQRAHRELLAQLDAQSEALAKLQAAPQPARDDDEMVAALNARLDSVQSAIASQQEQAQQQGAPAADDELVQTVKNLRTSVANVEAGLQKLRGELAAVQEGVNQMRSML